MEYKLFKTNGLNEIQSDISFVFYRMIHLGANEVFSGWPFIMLEIGGGWRGELVRLTRLLNWSDGDQQAEPGIRAGGLHEGRKSEPAASRNAVPTFRVTGLLQTLQDVTA